MAEMYLYNGIELPELPDKTVWDRETHPFAYVTEIPADHFMNPLGFNFFMLVVAEKTAIYDGSWVNIGIDSANKNQMQMFATPKKGVDLGDYEAIRGTWMYYETMMYWPQFATLATLTWTNTDIEYGGRVVYKATDPKPVGEEEPEPETMSKGKVMLIHQMFPKVIAHAMTGKWFWWE